MNPYLRGQVAVHGMWMCVALVAFGIGYANNDHRASTASPPSTFASVARSDVETNSGSRGSVVESRQVEPAPQGQTTGEDVRMHVFSAVGELDHTDRLIHL